MSLTWNIKNFFEQDSASESQDRVSVEYNLLSRRELYDKSIITADRYSSGAGEWVIRSAKNFYRVIVISRPYYKIPQILCLSFDCFSQEKRITSGEGDFVSIDQPIDQVAQEFSVLLSVFAREPIVPLGIRRIENHPTYSETHEIYPKEIDRSSPLPPYGIDSPDFITILKGFSSASDTLAQAILAAAKFYHAGLSLMQFDRSVAYITLVSSIECLAGFLYKDLKFEFDKVEKFKNVNPILHSIKELDGGLPLVRDLKTELIKAEWFLRNKFVRFIDEFTPQEFWDIPDELYKYHEIFPIIDRSNVDNCLKQIYDSRSAYLHGGTPFPIYVEYGVRSKHPIDMMGEMFQLKGKSKYLPPFAWFERLVHFVFIEFLKRHLAPVLHQKHISQLKLKEETFDTINNLPESAKESLKNLTLWTSRFLPYAVINPHAPNINWADSAETVEILLENGLIGNSGEGMDGSAWLLNREIGEFVGEYFLGAANNPFRGNELLLPKNWE